MDRPIEYKYLVTSETGEFKEWQQVARNQVILPSDKVCLSKEVHVLFHILLARAHGLSSILTALLVQRALSAIAPTKPSACLISIHHIRCSPSRCPTAGPMRGVRSQRSSGRLGAKMRHRHPEARNSHSPPLSSLAGKEAQLVLYHQHHQQRQHSDSHPSSHISSSSSSSQVPLALLHPR